MNFQNDALHIYRHVISFWRHIPLKSCPWVFEIYCLYMFNKKLVIKTQTHFVTNKCFLIKWSLHENGIYTVSIIYQNSIEPLSCSQIIGIRRAETISCFRLPIIIIVRHQWLGLSLTMHSSIWLIITYLMINIIREKIIRLLWPTGRNKVISIDIIGRRMNGTSKNIIQSVMCKFHGILSYTLPLEMSLDNRFIKFSNNVLNHSTVIIKAVASLSL